MNILHHMRRLAYPSEFKGLKSLTWTGEINQLRDPVNRRTMISRYANDKAIVMKTMGRLKYGIIPSRFLPLVDCSRIPPQFQYYWWRAISTAYIVRPNEYSIAWMKSHEMKDFEDHADKAIGVYVRRGDKEIEMRIVPVSEYTDSIAMLWKKGYLKQGSDSSKKNVFLASEDSGVIKETDEWSQKHSSEYFMKYTNVFDRAGLYAEKSHGERLKFMNQERHHSEEYLNMMLQVHYLLRSTAWVCTMSSNFCRVIDEMRATVGGKADHPYVDLSIETCEKVPCVYSGMYNFDWR